MFNKPHRPNKQFHNALRPNRLNGLIAALGGAHRGNPGYKMNVEPKSLLERLSKLSKTKD